MSNKITGRDNGMYLSPSFGFSNLDSPFGSSIAKVAIYPGKSFGLLLLVLGVTPSIKLG